MGLCATRHTPRALVAFVTVALLGALGEYLK
jgi:hypothetical protein